MKPGDNWPLPATLSTDRTVDGIYLLLGIGDTEMTIACGIEKVVYNAFDACEKGDKSKI